MMSSFFIVSLSVLFQAASTVIVLRLLAVVRKRPAVFLIIVTAVLMLSRRLLVLFYILSGNSLTPFEETHETLGLAVSFCLLGAAVWAVPRFLSLVRTRNELREKHSAVSQIIRDLAIPAFVIDKFHTVTHWNRACENLTGIPHEEIVGTRRPWRAFYMEPRPILADLIVEGAPEERIRSLYGNSCSPSSIIKGGWEAEFRLSTINRGKWLSFSAGPLHDSEGKICGAIETFQDTTRQREAEAHLSRNACRLRTLHDLVQEITCEKSIASLLDHTVKLLEKRMSISNVSILENLAENMARDVRLRLAAASSLDRETMERLTDRLTSSGRGLSVKAATERSVILTPDVTKSPDFVPFCEGTVSEIDVPIIDGERVLGVFSVEGYAPFDSHDRELYSILAGHLASLWKTIEMLREIESMALTDQLTGLPNRRALFERLAGEEARLLSYGGALSIVMLDMARFKQVNDAFGHLAGDEALRASSKFISGCLRSCDFAARFGGDEFVVLLPETKPEESERIIERIASGLSGICVNGMLLDLSADFGIASFPEDGQKLDSVLKVADNRMYEMKSSRT